MSERLNELFALFDNDPPKGFREKEVELFSNLCPNEIETLAKHVGSRGRTVLHAIVRSEGVSFDDAFKQAFQNLRLHMPRLSPEDKQRLTHHLISNADYSAAKAVVALMPTLWCQAVIATYLDDDEHETRKQHCMDIGLCIPNLQEIRENSWGRGSFPKEFLPRVPEMSRNVRGGDEIKALQRELEQKELVISALRRGRDDQSKHLQKRIEEVNAQKKQLSEKDQTIAELMRRIDELTQENQALKANKKEVNASVLEVSQCMSALIAARRGRRETNRPHETDPSSPPTSSVSRRLF